MPPKRKPKEEETKDEPVAKKAKTDSDEEKKDEGSDSDDEKKECMYGGTCYRKNPQHLKEFR